MAIPTPAGSLLRGHARCVIIPDRPCHWPVGGRHAVPGPGTGAADASTGCDPGSPGAPGCAAPADGDLGAWRCARSWPAPGHSRRSRNGLPTQTRPPGRRSASPARCRLSPRSGGPCRPWMLMPWMRQPAAGLRSALPRCRAGGGRLPWTARHCADQASPMALAGICWPRSITSTARSWARSMSRPRRTRSRCSPPCWTASTWPGRWLPRTRYADVGIMRLRGIHLTGLS